MRLSTKMHGIQNNSRNFEIFLDTFIKNEKERVREKLININV